MAVTKKKAALSTFSRVSSSSLSSSSFSNNNYDEEKEEHRKRLINKTLYRAKQRGFLELDVVVGEWAERKFERENDERFVFDSIRKSFGRGKSRFVLVFDWTKRSAEIFKRGKRGV